MLSNFKLVGIVGLLLIQAVAVSQASGVRGAAQEPAQIQRVGPPDPVASERVITVEGIATVRVVPSRLRVVFSVSANGTNARTASEAGHALVAETKETLGRGGIPPADIDVDFIAALPVFAWMAEKQGGVEVLAEKRVGTRVQHNLHVAVADEAAAMAAIDMAAGNDGVDLLAVDYWSSELETKQIEAQEKALSAAQRKAKLLLSGFPHPPNQINVHENTRVLFPQQLYQSLPTAEDSAHLWHSRDLPRVPASRPTKVYYRGLFGDADTGSKDMPGRRDIEIVSTVRLYFEAPNRPAPVK